MRIDEEPAEAFSRTLRVSCERMYEAYGASFVTADYVDGGAQPYTFDWASQCGCTAANPSPCFGNIIDVKAAWLAYPTNPTFAPAPTMVDAVEATAMATAARRPAQRRRRRWWRERCGRAAMAARARAARA